MPEDSPDRTDALTLAEEAEAEAEAALAEAHAKAARARAERLRRQAEAGAEPVPDLPEKPGRRRYARPAILGSVAVAVVALLSLSGLMAWKDHAAEELREHEAEAAAIARQGVVNIMSLDFTNAEGDVQRVLDSATGKFRTDFETESKFLIQALEESKVITEVTVKGVAVESVTADSAVVLVAAQSQASNARDARQDPQQFRVAVTLSRDAGALKMSQVDFL